ncbi:MAG TPA: peptidylprolyl isomerase [Dehalococcoidia bacterium]|nr:peptidylprolyl isomerase [Dehalococcoidia bacterium]
MGRLRRWLRRSGGGAALLLLCLLLAACSSNNANNAAKGTPAAATPVPGTSSRSFAKAPPFTIDVNKGYIATIKTDKGDIVVELNAKAAPLTVNNFVFLAQQHFYDGLTCHRVIPNFVAQCGDPKGDGTGGPGYTIPDEKSPLLHDTGAIAMAKPSRTDSSGNSVPAPNSAGSQFYITLSPQPSLDGQYTVFGQVIQGMDVAQSLTPRDPSANPSAPPGDRIISITIQVTDTTPTPFVPPTGTPVPLGTPAS